MKLTVANLKAASKKLGIPYSTILICQSMNADGINTNGTVNTGLLRTWYETHKLEINDSAEQSLADLKIVDKKKDIKLKELKIKSLEKELIEPHEVTALLVEIATQQSTLLKKIFLELPPQLAGLSEPEIRKKLDISLMEIFVVLQKKID